MAGPANPSDFVDGGKELLFATLVRKFYVGKYKGGSSYHENRMFKIIQYLNLIKSVCVIGLNL